MATELKKLPVEALLPEPLRGLRDCERALFISPDSVGGRGLKVLPELDPLLFLRAKEEVSKGRSIRFATLWLCIPSPSKIPSTE